MHEVKTQNHLLDLLNSDGILMKATNSCTLIQPLIYFFKYAKAQYTGTETNFGTCLPLSVQQKLVQRCLCV